MPADISLKGLKLVVDCAHGATYHVAQDVFRELGATVHALGVEPDGCNINRDCGSTAPAAVQQAVLALGADLGIAFDGDGDRVVFVDRTGATVDGDQILYVIAAHRRRHGGGCTGVVGTLMSNYGLELALTRIGVPFLRTAVGDRYVIEALRERLGLNLPVGSQLWNYLVGVFTRGDIGRSLVTDQPVLGLIASRAGVTALLVVVSVVFTVAITVPLALLAATHKDGPFDHLVRIVPTVGMAMPAFWVGLILILVFGVNLRWLPVGGIGTSPGDPLRSLVLPGLTVAFGLSPPLIRSLREQLLEVLEADFVVTLRAARVPWSRILWGHVLRNAAVPATSLLGVSVAYLIGGTLVIERVFAINGLGALLFSAISSRDFPVVQGVALVCAFAVVLVSLAVDALVALLDPRIRLP